MNEFNELNSENKKQNIHVDHLRGLLQKEVRPNRILMKQSLQVEVDTQKEIQYFRSGSRSRGKGLFKSNNLGRANGKTLLKRVRSS